MIATPVLIDTGPLVAILSEDDGHHERCVRQLHDLRRPALTCWPVITEAAYLLRKHRDAVSLLLSKCDGSRFRILPLTASDLPAIDGILTKYRDQQLDLADAALMHLAEREGIESVFTVDYRHFSVYRPSSGRQLRLLPAP